MYSIYSAITIAWLTLLLVFFGPTQLEPSLSLFALCALVTTLVGYEIGHWIAVFLGSRIQRKRVAVQSRKMTALRNSDASESKVFLLATPVSSKNQYLICCKNDDGSLEQVYFAHHETILISEDQSLTEDGIWTTTELQPDVSDRLFRWARAYNTDRRNELRVPLGSLGTIFLTATKIQTPECTTAS